MNWSVILGVGLPALLFIGFLLWKNLRDKKEFEEKLNQDYRKSKDEEEESGIDEGRL